eukprot:1142195-Rhodomonas_salina.2
MNAFTKSDLPESDPLVSKLFAKIARSVPALGLKITDTQVPARTPRRDAPGLPCLFLTSRAALSGHRQHDQLVRAVHAHACGGRRVADDTGG